MLTVPSAGGRVQGAAAAGPRGAGGQARAVEQSRLHEKTKEMSDQLSDIDCLNDEKFVNYGRLLHFHSL